MPVIVQEAITLTDVELVTIAFAWEDREDPPRSELVMLLRYRVMTDTGAVYANKTVGVAVPAGAGATISDFLTALGTVPPETPTAIDLSAAAVAFLRRLEGLDALA